MTPDWQTADGSIRLYCADCLDILPTLEAGSVDAVVTDPPYGVGCEYESFDDTQENVTELVRAFIPEVQRVAIRSLITCGIACLHSYPKPTWTLAWFNPAAGATGKWGFNCWQPILAYGPDPFLAGGLGRRPDIIRPKLDDIVGRADMPKGHPCPKPLGLWSQVVLRASVSIADTILDPFMGSGTTGVACVRLGRRFIGVEKEEKYFNIAVERIQKELDRFPLFEDRTEVTRTEPTLLPGM